MTPTLTPRQHHAMIYTERIMSSISIIGILFIIFTYLFCSSFSKPINRLVFYASWGNLGLCIVALISMDGPDAGQNSPLCQFQGFMAQLFLGVDAYWAFCMAVNIYLVFFRSYNTRQLRALDRKYFVACYGFALIPAIIYLFIETKDRGKIYGGAVLWCWVSREWDFLRIAVLYVFMWIAVLIAVIIYIMAGRHVYRKRAALDGFLNPFNEDPFTTVILTTEVTITSTDRKPSVPNYSVREIDPQPPLPSRHPSLPKTHPTSTPHDSSDTNEEDYTPYTIDISTSPRPQPTRTPSSRPALFRIPTYTRAAALSQENAEAFLYARVAFLFFIALLITWVPSSVNRAYALAHPEHINFGLNFCSAFVFSVQGLLNCVVYVVTSQGAVRGLWGRLWRGRGGAGGKDRGSGNGGKGKGFGGGVGLEEEGFGRRRVDSDATSTTNLTAR